MAGLEDTCAHSSGNDRPIRTPRLTSQKIMAQTGFRSFVALPLLIDKTVDRVLLLIGPPRKFSR